MFLYQLINVYYSYKLSNYCMLLLTVIRTKLGYPLFIH